MSEKKLRRSNNKMIAGVCAGIAEYFEIDPTLIRVIWAIAALIGGTGILAYLVSALIMPKE